LIFLIWIPSEGDALNLITPEEASQPDAPIPKGIESIKIEGNGPRIKIASPPLDKPLKVPFVIDILFEGLSNKSIDYESLRVRYLKLVPIDLTNRLRHYLRENRLLVKDVKVPQGIHRLQVLIAYTSGEKTVMDIVLTID